jgi:multiple sugar transport system ATP-binding protein
LARDVGQESKLQAADPESGKTTMVGRFGPRSRVKNGDKIDVAVDTSGVHLFDIESGEGIYG